MIANSKAQRNNPSKCCHHFILLCHFENTNKVLKQIIKWPFNPCVYRVSFRENPMSLDAQSKTLFYGLIVRWYCVTVDETQFIIKKKRNTRKKLTIVPYDPMLNETHTRTPNYAFERKIFKILNHFIWLMMFWVCAYVYILFVAGRLALSGEYFVKRQQQQKVAVKRAGFLWQM